MTIKQKKTIAIAATGGTIAGTGEAGKTAVYHAGEMNVESILETIPMIRNVADIETVQLFNVDSNEMDEEKWITLRISSMSWQPVRISMELWSHMEQIPWMRPHIFKSDSIYTEARSTYRSNASGHSHQCRRTV